MSLKDTIYNDMTDSLKERDADTLGVLRILIAEINRQEIESGKKDGGLDDEDVQKVILREIKKRKESIEKYKGAGRLVGDERVEEEEKELGVLEKYAPKQMSKEDVEKVVEKHISDSGATTMQDMGKVMKGVMGEVGNSADGSMIQEVVKEKLSS